MCRTMILMDGLYDLYGLDGEERDDHVFLPMLGPKWQGSTKVARGVRKLWLSSPIPGKKALLGRWTEILEQFDTVILSDYSNTPSVVRFIHKEKPCIRIIVWYHNPVEVSVPLDSFYRSDCELWSFDPADCERYGLSYNPQFYIPSTFYRNSAPELDAFYVGTEKGRGDVLRDISDNLSELGFRCEFDVVGVNAERMPYSDVLKKIARSRVVVDCLSPWQSGMTLRPLEAMFYSKKLITNQTSIKEMDFYNPENVFVWGDDGLNDLEAFMNSPVKAVPTGIKQSYDLEGWLGRFNHT